MKYYISLQTAIKAPLVTGIFSFEKVFVICVDSFLCLKFVTTDLLRHSLSNINVIFTERKALILTYDQITLTTNQSQQKSDTFHWAMLKYMYWIPVRPLSQSTQALFGMTRHVFTFRDYFIAPLSRSYVIFILSRKGRDMNDRLFLTINMKYHWGTHHLFH